MIYRLLGGLIGVSLCFNFVGLPHDPGMIIFSVLVAFVFWGIGINVLGYIVSSQLSNIIPAPKETIYRCLILGHLPLISAFVAANGIEIINTRTGFLLITWALSGLIASLLIWKIASEHEVKQDVNPDNVNGP